MNYLVICNYFSSKEKLQMKVLEILYNHIMLVFSGTCQENAFVSVIEA